MAGDLTKRLLVGRPMRSDRLQETELPKWLALPVFCSDPLSSVAYATEAILVALSVGGLAFYHTAPYIAAAVAVLLVVVVLSYRQTVYAYPNGGGAYVVASENLGRTAGLAAASALLVDYVLTVSVSVAAGVSNITSAAPRLAPDALPISLGFVALLMLMNLRGVRESGQVFAIPTYGFVFGVYVMFAWAAYKGLAGHPLRAESADYTIRSTGHTAGILAVLLILRAFANGCTALTGVEAISNGVPAFRRPKSRNAAQTLTGMAFLAVTMFVGITVLALVSHVHMAESSSQYVGLPADADVPTAISQVSEAVFGKTFFFYWNTVFTAGILILAANTAYNGFPALASILARDRFLPRQLYNRGDKLVFSNGIVLLSLAAALLLIAFDADTNKLIHLYIIGVFVSFTLSQAGMVRHWQKELAASAVAVGADPLARRRVRRSQLINTVGASVTGLVLIIVLATKFLQGAYIVVIAMPLLFLMMRGIRRHYDRIAEQLAPPDAVKLTRPSRNHVIVLVSRLHLPTVRALSYARALNPNVLEAVTVAVTAEEAQSLLDEWESHGVDVPLRVLDSPFREITRPVLDYVRSVHRSSPRDVVTVVIPEYVATRWWQLILHNQSALRIKARLLFQPGVAVTSVPWLIDTPPGVTEPPKAASTRTP
ncbi:APC family permease [Frankia sp. Mgl5]|uniref:APC family permease n=1 Tax=Frankia sp. Mgl5 TaxID=2933793 RepID=UPI00200CF627|nr:APC family permease [Frankia sp. Mgl5]MCK9930593.1 APC family permease [Frankia sp. Mgl5]